MAATDAFNDDDGDFALLATAEEPKLAGQWVHFENGADRIQFTLGAGQSRLLPFSFELPADATPGDHVGGLLASIVTPGAQVNLDRRVATRLYARVSGQLQPMLTVAGIGGEYVGDWWNPFDGAVRLHYTIANTGNVALASNVTATVNTWFGIAARPATGGGVKEILPGSTVAVDVDLPGIAQWGYLNPAVTLSPFVETEDPARQLPVSTTSRDVFVIAVPWLLLLVLALVALGFVLVRRRRRRDEERVQAWLAYTEEEARRAAGSADLVGAGSSVSEAPAP